MDFEAVVAFHGHRCPGLAIGYRMTQASLEALTTLRAGDEELVAIVENDACGVDALQCLSGCTFGKGNLLFRDYGKNVYTLYCRDAQRGVRVAFDGRQVPESVKKDRQSYIEWLLKEPRIPGLSLVEVTIDEPQRARIRTSHPCAACGEPVMETRLRDGLCIPCAEAVGG